MSFNTSSNAETAKRLLTFNKNSKNTFNHRKASPHDDLENDSELQPCLQHLASGSELATKGEIYNADDSSLKLSERSQNGSNNGFYTYLANKNINPTGSLKTKEFETKKVSSVKRLSSRPECFSVKYSVGESKPLISVEDYKIDLEYKNIPRRMSNPQQRKIQLQRPSSLGDISERVLNIKRKNKNKALACRASNQAASHPPQSANNCDSNAAFISGSLNLQHPHVLHVNTSCDCQDQPHPTSKLSAESEQLTDPSLPLIEPLSTLQLNYCCAKSSPRGSHTPDNLCSNHACPSRLSLFQSNKDNNATGMAIAPKPTQIFPPYSADTKYINGISSYPFGSDINTPVIANSTAQVAAPISEFAQRYPPGSVSASNHYSRASTDDKKPLQVPVPQRYAGAGVNNTHSAENGHAQHSPFRHITSHENIVHPLYQHTSLDSAHPRRLSHSRSVQNSIAMEESSDGDNIQGITHAISNEADSNVPNRTPYPTTFPSTTNRNCFSSFSTLPNNQVCSYGDGFAAYYPHLMCNHNTYADPASVWRHHDLTHIQLSSNSEPESVRSQGFVDSSTTPECDLNSHSQRLNKPNMPHLGQCECNANRIVSNKLPIQSNNTHTVLPSQSNTQEHNLTPMHERIILSHSNNTAYGLPNSNNGHDFHEISINATQSKSNEHDSHKNADNMTVQFRQAKQLNQHHQSKIDVMGNAQNMNNLQRKDKGNISVTKQGVRTPYVDATLLGSQENLVGYKRASTRSSVPTSIDSGHPANREGSLPRSCTSELSYAKANLETSRIAPCFHSDTPDYWYLCIVATVLNPLLGVAAFFFNHFARKNFQRHKLAKANNQYFATITISTVAIFLTLVTAVLLITHNVLTPSEKTLSALKPSTNSCESRLLGTDESFKTFFEMDLNLFCVVTKNEKIMEALKHYLLEDLQNRNKFNKPIINNGTASGQINDINATNSALNNSNHNSHIGSETNLNTTDFIKNMDVQGRTSDVSRSTTAKFVQPSPPKPVKSNKYSHNTALSSNDGPVVPPGLEAEYQQYLKGNKRTKLEDASPLLQESVYREKISEQSPTSTQTRLTTGTTTGTTDGITTETATGTNTTTTTTTTAITTGITTAGNTGTTTRTTTGTTAGTTTGVTNPPLNITSEDDFEDMSVLAPP